MGDTQKSPTISTANQRIAAKAADDSGQGSEDANREGAPLLVGESSLVRIKMLAESDPNLVFTSVAHRIDVYLLKKSFRQLRKSKSAGVDKITAKQYAKNLDENLYNLHQRLRRGQYVATPVKRIWIDKEGGKKRPIGIPALEDKIVQRAVSTILNIIYDVNFFDFSHAFRKGHSQHKALHELRDLCRKLNIGWIVSADIEGLFDNIDHKLLRECIKRRVNDGGILRLIGKWLNAGVMEEGTLSYPGKGVPQGGVISPLLANLYLHWFDKVFHQPDGPANWANARLVRYADDFVVLAQYQSSRLSNWIEAKLESWMGLEINREKTQVVNLRKVGQSLDFLGFTFRFDRSLYKNWKRRYLNVFVSEKSVAREREKLRELTARRRSCMPIPLMIREVNRQLTGWGNYFNYGYPRKAFRKVNSFLELRLMAHLKRRSQRPFRIPKGRTVHKHLKCLGLVNL